MRIRHLFSSKRSVLIGINVVFPLRFCPGFALFRVLLFLPQHQRDSTDNPRSNYGYRFPVHFSPSPFVAIRLIIQCSDNLTVDRIWWGGQFANDRPSGELVDFSMTRNGLQIAGDDVAVEVVPADSTDKNATLVTKTGEKIASLQASSNTPE